MELILFIVAVGLVCAIVWEPRRSRKAPEEWSPFDGFYSDRAHWRPPDR